MRQIILIDGNSVYWRVFYAAGVSSDDSLTKGILLTLNKIFRDCACEGVVFWDSGAPRWRSEVFPEYKSGRERQKLKLDIAEIMRQVDISKFHLRNLGIRQVEVTGVEADDLMAFYATGFEAYNLYDRILLATTDKDSWQLVNNKINVYDFSKERLIAPESVKHYLGVQPKDVVDLKVLTGDSSDSIKGVKGIGPKTALSLFEKYGSLAGILSKENQTELKKSRRTKVIFNYLEELSLNYQLIKLPDYRTFSQTLDDEERDSFLHILSNVPSPSSQDRMFTLDAYPNLDALKSAGGSQTVLNNEAHLTSHIQKDEAQRLISLREVDESVLMCNKCPLRADCGDHGPTLPEGYDTAKIMLIGRNPGQEETEQRKPFIGKSGKRVDKMLFELNLERESLWITNTCKCYSEGNRPVSNAEIMTCSDYLRAEINILKPKLIITFGNEAMSMVTPYGSGVTDHCGEILTNPNSLRLKQQIEATVAICVHPSSALRSKKYEEEFSYATKKIKEFLEEKRSC